MRAWQRALFLPLVNYVTYTGKVQALGPIAYWPLAEASGSTIVDASGNGRNGAYTAVTLGAAGIGDGRTSASFDGSASFGDIYSASLAGAFNGAEGTAMGWCRVSGAGVWTDATIRRVIYLQADANNRVLIQRSSTNNVLDFIYIAGATNKTTSNAAGPTTGWLHVAITWSKSADQVKGYVSGAQIGATQTGLGTFAGSLATTTTLLGASAQTPSNVWSGTLAHMAIFTRALSATEIASAAAA